MLLRKVGEVGERCYKVFSDLFADYAETRDA
jgi:hypothetical protein